MALRSLLVIGMVAAAEGARACATCGGPADAAQTQGMNAAILTLFGVLCVVGVTVASFVAVIAWRIVRHQRKHESSASEMPAMAVSLES